jgi:hypothetical protein
MWKKVDGGAESLDAAEVAVREGKIRPTEGVVENFTWRTGYELRGLAERG